MRKNLVDSEECVKGHEMDSNYTLKWTPLEELLTQVVL